VSDRYADWVPVIPATGRVKETAKELLALAGNPALVRTDGNGLEFLVHPAVADAYTTPSFTPPRPRPRRGRAKKSED
jgi:hypothetical protein